MDGVYCRAEQWTRLVSEALKVKISLRQGVDFEDSFRRRSLNAGSNKKNPIKKV